MRLAWEGMIPASLLVMLTVSFFLFMGWTDYMWLGSIGCIVLIYVILPFMPQQADPNHRTRLIGSRFSPAGDDPTREQLTEATSG